MKKYRTGLLSLIILSATTCLIGCNDLLDVRSERYTDEADFRMNTVSDTLYSTVGIFSKLQKLGDRYVLLGELRGDLMETSEEASLYLKEIQNFNISKNNPYINQSDYYAVINQCNYIITYADTAYKERNVKPFLRVFAAAKAIRAWTYFQLALNVGSVSYYEKPILSVKDAERSYPVYTLSELAPVLIADLLPMLDVPTVNLGTFNEFNSNYSIMPVPLLLGDLYLWSGAYEQAATMYYKLINTKKLIVSDQFSNKWGVDNSVFKYYYYNWQFSFSISANNNEIISALASSADYGQPFNVDSLSYNRSIVASKNAIQQWNKPIYYHSAAANQPGDLRCLSTHSDRSFFQNIVPIKPTDKHYILKYAYMNTDKEEKVLVLCKNSLLYLRYAEAINRLGYPQVAFAILKRGLKKETFDRPEIAAEVQSNGALRSFMRFTDSRYDGNVGTRMRGCGNVDKDLTFFNIPSTGLSTLADSMDYVEDVLVDELALETAFEGNRFHDLMRIALRRNDPSYLANRVAKKYSFNQEAIRSKLLEPANWYIPKK